MADFTVTLSDADFSRALGSLTSKLDGNGLRPVLESIGEYLYDQVQTRFDTQKDPQGNPWTAISPEWRKRKEEQGRITKILQYRGDLRRSIVYQVQASQRRVIIGSNLPYASIHQFGGTIRREASTRTLRFNVSRTGRSRFASRSKANFEQDANVGPYTIEIDARPYLGINDRDRAEIIEIIRDHIVDS